MKYLVIGKNGQLGKEYVRRLSRDGKDFVALGHEELDIADLKKVLAVFEQVNPAVVINTAAYNQVDLAETRYDLAYKTNSLGVYNLLFAREKYNSFLIHFSTEYVFDGKKENGLYTEEDQVNPLNEYGKSKYLGELFIRENNADTLLFRTSWVFGEGKQNFIYKFLEWTKKNNILKISNDEVSSPTSCKTIVEISLKALEAGFTGLYHLTSSGYCSRYELAQYITKYRHLDNIIEPVPTASFNLPARRPKFSPMDNQKISKALGCEIPLWTTVLEDYLNSL